MLERSSSVLLLFKIKKYRNVDHGSGLSTQLLLITYKLQLAEGERFHGDNKTKYSTMPTNLMKMTVEMSKVRLMKKMMTMESSTMTLMQKK